MNLNDFFVGLGEFLKVWIGPLLTLAALIPTYIFIRVNYKKIIQDIQSAKAKQNLDDLSALEKYRTTLDSTFEDNLSKSQTLASLKNDYEAIKTDYNTMKSLVQARDVTISNLVTELSLEKAAREKQDARILEQDQRIEQLTTELAAEREKRLTAAAELENLKVSSEILREGQNSTITKLTARVKTLEDTLISNNIPLPNGS